MSTKRVKRLKLAREVLADRLASERRKKVKGPNVGQVIARLGEHMAGRSEQLPIGGAQSNNMAPSKYMADDASVNVLQQGIDSIWLNVYGSIREDVLECLEMGKEDAQNAEGDWALSPLPPFDGTTPLILASGVKFYHYLCRSDDVEVKIAKPNNSPRPVAVVRVSAQALWRFGGGGVPATKLAAEWLRPLFEEDTYRVTLSQVHIATDFQGWCPQLEDLGSVVKRAGDDPDFDDEVEDVSSPVGRLTAHRDRARRLTGVNAGVSANIRLNFYNKSYQVMKKRLGWVESLWEQCPGYKVREDVWRVEYQYGREFLHGRGIETLEDLWGQLGALWEYGMGWYSFREPNASDSNRSRWAVASYWRKLTAWRDSVAGELPKVEVVRPKFKAMCAGTWGYVTSVMALVDVDDPRDALGWVVEVMKAQKGVERMERVIAEKRLRYAGFTMASV